MAELIFDADGHKYYLDGEQIPSVTGLVSIYTPKQYTDKNKGEDEKNEKLALAMDAAAERGTMVHGYIAHLLNGGNAEDYEMPREYGGYVDAVELFLAERHIEPCAIETPMWGIVRGLTLAGTPDLSAYCDGVLTLFDYKCVAAVEKTKVGAQLNGYSLLCEYNGIYHEKLIAVQFMGNGTYRLYNAGIDDTDFNRAVDVFNLANYKKHPKGGIA